MSAWKKKLIHASRLHQFVVLNNTGDAHIILQILRDGIIYFSKAMNCDDIVREVLDFSSIMESVLKGEDRHVPR